MYERYPDPQCIGATRMVGYASEIGLMANPTGAHIEIKYTKALFADNQRGVTLRYAHETDDNTAFLEDSYIMGYSRPDCDSCYSNDTIKYCSGGYAIRMLATTISGEAFPLAKLPTGFDVICTRESYDFKAYLNNVVFENYYHTNTDVPYCSNMKVFKRHILASDGTGSHYLTNTECRNCEEQAWAFFEKPNVGWRGWFGGCGELDCTGPNNYFIHDQDGAFTGSPSQILANNSVVAADPSLNCREIPEINGHLCDTEDLVVLEYESIAPDFNLRIMWPIYLKYEGGSWESETNGWREWQWDGPEPMNRRLARFWSTVKRHENYNLTYSGTPPSDSRFQIQKRSLPTGNPDDWVIIRIYYPLPNSIEVLVKNIHGKDQMIRPFPIREGVAEDLTNHVDTCGANNFHFENGTIEFVVNGKDNCQVRVRLSSFIQLSVRLDIPIADFYTNDGETTFLTNICAFLGIDTGRMKIVGVDVGSTVVNATIQTENSDIDEATETEPDAQGEYEELTELQAKLDEEFSTGNTQINLGAAVLNYETSMKTYNIDGSEYIPSEEEKEKEEEPEGKEKDNLVLIIVLATVVPLLAITLGVGIYCYVKRKRARIETLEVEEIDPNDSEIHGGVGVTTDDFSLETKHKKNWRV